MKNLNLHPVIIAGTGPGDPDLLVVKAYNAMTNADIILYDCMPARFVLEIKNENTEIIFLEKNHEAKEEEQKAHLENIIDQLEKYYLAGKKIVRLKAGDALMFGGAGIEAEMLTQRNIPFEIIPGLTAGAAAAGISGIKLSEKDESDLVAYYIGWDIKDNFSQVRHLASLLKAGGTLILYMADKNLLKITEVLKEEGVPGSLPVVASGMVSLPGGKCASSILDELPSLREQQEIPNPVTYFLGQFVKTTILKELTPEEAFLNA